MTVTAHPATVYHGGSDALRGFWRGLAAMNIYDFKVKWRGTALTERSASHQHFLDLCEALGMPTPAKVDPTELSVGTNPRQH